MAFPGGMCAPLLCFCCMSCFTRPMLADIARRFAILVAINTSIVVLLGCTVALSLMAEPNRQQHSPDVIDRWDPETGQIIRENR